MATEAKIMPDGMTYDGAVKCIAWPECGLCPFYSDRSRFTSCLIKTSLDLAEKKNKASGKEVDVMAKKCGGKKCGGGKCGK